MKGFLERVDRDEYKIIEHRLLKAWLDKAECQFRKQQCSGS